jgi:hypothetical protein
VPTSSVVLRAFVRTGACGIADYTRQLAASFEAHGFKVILDLRDEEVASVAGSIRGARWACQSTDSVLVFQYASFSGTYRGIPSGASFAALAQWRSGGRTITVIHEMYPSFGHGWRQNALAVMHRLAVLPLLLCSDRVVVTTEQRAASLRWLSLIRRAPVVVPVFSNWPEVVGGTKDPATLVMVAWSHEGVVPELWAGALNGSFVKRVIFLGSPGEASAWAARWRQALSSYGIDWHFTNLLSEEDAAAELARATVVVAPSARGTGSRNTTLAAALRNGCAVITVEGPDSWRLLRQSGAVREVGHTRHDVTSALAELGREDVRLQLGAAAKDFYGRNMSVEITAPDIIGLV